VNLRGLGADSTLVLVNGRRLAGTGLKGDFADVSALPTAAVERVDVLLDGASALYGSDAVGGVVNIILRRDFEGQETRLRAAAAKGGAEDLIVAHTAGRRWSTGGVVLSLEHGDQNALNAEDRAYTSTGDLRPFGGSDRRGLFALPGNIVGFDPVSGGFVSTFALRPGADGVANTPAEFVAGATNLANVREGVDLQLDQQRTAAYGAIDQRVGDRVKLTADLRLSERRFAFANIPPSTILTVSRANPFFVSPTGAPSHSIAYSFGPELGPSRRTGESRSVGVTAGAEIELPFGLASGRLRRRRRGAHPRPLHRSDQQHLPSRGARLGRRQPRHHVQPPAGTASSIPSAPALRTARRSSTSSAAATAARRSSTGCFPPICCSAATSSNCRAER
jgi:hypothetical protein